MDRATDPQHLSKALSELIALKGLVRIQGQAQLSAVWDEAAGPKIASATKVIGIKRGVLQIGVASAPLLSELVSFHKTSLLRTLQSTHGELRVRDLKFRLRSDLSQPSAP